MREFKTQLAKGSRSYDFVLESDGLIHPMTGEFFVGIDMIDIILLLGFYVIIMFILNVISTFIYS